MTELGLAQERLFNDDASTAAQPLSTTTHYPSEISQPGSFPAMQSYDYQQAAPVVHQAVQYANIRQDITSEATQLLSANAVAYDYSTPAASTHVDSPSNDLTAQTSVSMPLHEHNLEVEPHKNPLQHNAMQPIAYSPHDTEPFSSVATPQHTEAKNVTSNPGLASPHPSPAMTHDELALPAAPVLPPAPAAVAALSTGKKRRGRPKKVQAPTDDDDDELATATGSEPSPTKSKAKHFSVQISNGNDTETTGDLSVSAPIKKSKIVKLSVSTGEETTSEPEKKKAKRKKTASSAKPQASDADDDVIWVDSRTISSTESEEPIKAPLQQLDNHTETTTADEKPAPKKRGRKRKQKEPAPEVAPEPPIEHEIPVSKEAEQVVDPPVVSKDQPENEVDTTVQNPDSVPKDPPAVPGQQEAPPQTPLKPEQNPSTPVAGSTNARKGLSKHSPISSTSKVPYRVGLSKRARIAPLLKMVRK